MIYDAYLLVLLALKEVVTHTDGRTDGQTDGRTFAFLELLSQLKRLLALVKKNPNHYYFIDTYFSHHFLSFLPGD